MNRSSSSTQEQSLPISRSQPALFLPCVNLPITKQEIYDLIETQYGFGKIFRVDIVKCKKFSRIYINFDYWYSSHFATAIRKKLMEGKDIHLVYKTLNNNDMLTICANKSSLTGFKEYKNEENYAALRGDNIDNNRDDNKDDNKFEDKLEFDMSFIVIDKNECFEEIQNPYPLPKPTLVRRTNLFI